MNNIPSYEWPYLIVTHVSSIRDIKVVFDTAVYRITTHQMTKSKFSLVVVSEFVLVFTKESVVK